MEPDTFPEASSTRWVFHLVAPSLYWREPTGKYYALRKRDAKQFRSAPKIEDGELTKRRLNELRTQAGNVEIP